MNEASKPKVTLELLASLAFALINQIEEKIMGNDKLNIGMILGSTRQ